MRNNRPAQAGTETEVWVFYEDMRGKLRRWSRHTAENADSPYFLEATLKDAARLQPAKRWGTQRVQVTLEPVTGIQWEE